MTLVTSGLLRFGQASDTDNRSLVAEFGGTPPHSLSDYYAGAGLVPTGTTGTGGPIPSSGPIRFSDFYGASNTFTATLTIGTDVIPGNTYWGYADANAETGVSPIGSITNTDVYGNLLRLFTLVGSGIQANTFRLTLNGDHAAVDPFFNVEFMTDATTSVNLTAATAISKQVLNPGGANERTRWVWGSPVFPRTTDWGSVGGTRAVTINPP